MLCFESLDAVPAVVSHCALGLLHEGGVGEVIMVNSAGIYLEIKDRIVLLCDRSWGAVPIGIAVEDLAGWARKLKIEQGQKVEFCEKSIVFSGRTLNIAPTLPTMDRTDHGKPQTRLIKKAAEDLVELNKERGISMLVLPLVLGDDERYVASINPYCARALPLLLRLADAMISCSTRDIRDCVDLLLGLGTGLTPSADDVMLGMLYAFRKLGGEAPRSLDTFRASILDMCDTHTVKVSAAYLKSVIDGDYFERIERVWLGICGAEPFDASPLLEIGSSSGSEMLLGMLLALKISGYSITKK